MSSRASNNRLAKEYLAVARNKDKSVFEKTRYLKNVNEMINLSAVDQSIYGQALKDCSDIIEDSLYLPDSTQLAEAAVNVITSIANKGKAFDAYETLSETFCKVSNSSSPNKSEISKAVSEGIKVSANKHITQITRSK